MIIALCLSNILYTVRTMYERGYSVSEPSSHRHRCCREARNPSLRKHSKLTRRPNRFSVSELELCRLTSILKAFLLRGDHGEGFLCAPSPEGTFRLPFHLGKRFNVIEFPFSSPSPNWLSLKCSYAHARCRLLPARPEPDVKRIYVSLGWLVMFSNAQCACISVRERQRYIALQSAAQTSVLD